MNRPSAVLVRQTSHEFVSLRRRPITLILGVGFPLVFFVLVSSLVGNVTLDERLGVRLAQFLAPSLACFGVAMATFTFLAYGFAEARSSGLLKRQRATPLPPWILLGGRMGAAMLLGLIATCLVIAVGVAFYGVQVMWRTVPAVLLTIVVASLTFSVLGLALASVLPTPQLTLAITNGVAITLAFFSDIFQFGSGVPQWASTIGWVFPLKHLVHAFADAFNPFLSGPGFYWDHLAVILLWGCAGALVATWAVRREREGGSARLAHGRPVPSQDLTPRHADRPTALLLLADQVRHTMSVLARNPSSVFFAVAFPVLLVVIIPTVNGGGQQLLGNGIQLGAFFASTMAVYGAAVTAYVNMPTALAEARDKATLKRLHGTPLPAWALLGGRVTGAVCVAVLTLAACFGVAALMYRSPMPSWPAALLSYLTTAVCFAFLGLAVACLARSAQSVSGLTLGTLLPLCFVSDIFVIGAQLPDILERISWVFPLRHASAAMTATLTQPVAAPAWEHLAVIAGWGLAGALVVTWRFSWEVRSGRRTRGTPSSRGDTSNDDARAGAATG